MGIDLSLQVFIPDSLINVFTYISVLVSYLNVFSPDVHLAFILMVLILDFGCCVNIKGSALMQ